MNEPKPDLSSLLPDDATLSARRSALVDAVGPSGEGPQRKPGWRRRGPRLALGAVMVAAAVAVALIVGAGGDNPSAAFAVEPQQGGGVTIRVYRLEDASGLERALEEAGIEAQVSWLPPRTLCREPHFTPSSLKLPGGGTQGGFDISGPGALTISIGSAHGRRPPANVNLDPKAFRPGQSVVLFGSPQPFGGDPEGGFQARFRIAEGPVEPCEPQPAPASSIGAIALSQGGGGEHASSGNETGRPPAAGAEASDAPAEATPASGQLFFAKTKVVQLQGWEPDGPGTGSRSEPRYFTANLLGPENNALPALIPTLREVWTAPDGKTRVRETLGRIRFLSKEDQRRWEEAGSPPPFEYDPAAHAVKRDGSGRLVKEFASRSWRGRREFSNVGKLSRLPTEPEPLRLAIENRPGGSAPVEPSPVSSHRGSVTAERLLEILGEPITSPALRAAALNALAELPGIGVERGVADVAGRRGDAITWVRERGFGRELIFDPHTSEVLAQAEMIFGPSSTGDYGVPAGTVFRETAYLRSGVVNAPYERPGG